MAIVANRDLDEVLIRQLSLGDQKALESLYRLYYKQLCQFAFLILHSKELSEEAVSDVFFNIWMKREQLASIRNIRAYLYKAVHNQAIDYLRTNPAQSHENINDYQLEIESPDPAVDEVIEREQLHELLQQTFDMLPERCRMIARMHFNDQLQYKEIAEILGISRKTVEAQIAIATRKVNEIFEKYGLKK